MSGAEVSESCALANATTTAYISFESGVLGRFRHSPFFLRTSRGVMLSGGIRRLRDSVAQ